MDFMFLDIFSYKDLNYIKSDFFNDKWRFITFYILTLSRLFNFTISLIPSEYNT